ncbi:hypothetical protein [Mesorhizobium sp.]|uniref:hypothetical protein n=1 Tax=Mesorhizobium sp. TaxID=1871066 RepID=UPI0025D82D15|nr:hypothetical protein [Mesorhizobium sp.]
MAAPFIGYAILYHSTVERYLGGLGGLLSLQTDVGSCAPWLTMWQKLNLTYLALVLLGVGSIVFRTLAPKTIKIYGNISHYVERELPRVTARNLRSLFVTVSARRPHLRGDFLERAAWLARDKASLKSASDSLQQAKDDQLAIDVLRSYYNVMNRYTLRLAVYLTIALYALGFILLSAAGLDLTRRVLCVMIK